MLNGASDRTHRITLRRPDIVADGYGGQKRAFSNYATRWAQVKPPAYREQQAQGAPMSREEIVVEITPADNAVAADGAYSGKTMSTLSPPRTTHTGSAPL